MLGAVEQALAATEVHAQQDPRSLRVFITDNVVLSYAHLLRQVRVAILGEESTVRARIPRHSADGTNTRGQSQLIILRADQVEIGRLLPHLVIQIMRLPALQDEFAAATASETAPASDPPLAPPDISDDLPIVPATSTASGTAWASEPAEFVRRRPAPFCDSPYTAWLRAIGELSPLRR